MTWKVCTLAISYLAYELRGLQLQGVLHKGKAQPGDLQAVMPERQRHVLQPQQNAARQAKSSTAGAHVLVNLVSVS